MAAKTSVTLPEEPGTQTQKTQGRTRRVSVDFDKAGRKDGGNGSPFQKAKAADKRLKLFLWGDTGAGKTTLALQFPKPVVIDMEGGADLYGDSFNFDVLRSSSPEEVMASVDWLLANKHPYRTLIIDPITIYWESLQKKWSDIFLHRRRDSKGYRHEFYDLQVKDWMTIKAEFRELLRKLIALDMNVIVTARQKTKYKEGSFMVAIGETFDGEKSLPYMFDTIVRMWIDGDGKFMGACIKDRSNRLPKGEFECSYTVFEKAFGKKQLGRKSREVFATAEQQGRIKELTEKLGFSLKDIEERVAEVYGAENLETIGKEAADEIIGKLEESVKKLNQ
jgi:hypothetical protein